MIVGDDHSRAERAVRLLLQAIGEDPDREELEETPERVAKIMTLFGAGASQALGDILEEAVSSESTEGMVTFRAIAFCSLCERHLLPFFGHAHVAYLPAGRVLDPSGLPRLVDVLARRLQSQERLADRIARSVQSAVEPRGVAVRLEASHLCMVMRGIERQESVVMTSSFLGDFESDMGLRQEFNSALGPAFGPRPRRAECRATVGRSASLPRPSEVRTKLEASPVRVGVFKKEAPPVPRGKYPQRVGPRPGSAAGEGR